MESSELEEEASIAGPRKYPDELGNRAVRMVRSSDEKAILAHTGRMADRRPEVGTAYRPRSGVCLDPSARSRNPYAERKVGCVPHQTGCRPLDAGMPGGR